MINQAEQQIERFRQGETFHGDIHPFLMADKPDDGALDLMEAALHKDSAFVREQVAKALIAVGRKTDPLRHEGGNLIRHPRIIALLANAGLSQLDSAHSDCLNALLESAPAERLKAQGAALTANLKRWPDTKALLVVAKAKPAEAVSVVERLAHLQPWSHIDETKIAQAALGDAAVEKKFVTDFLAANDPNEKARLAHLLGNIGTRSTLHALASEMRTGLIFVLTGSFQRSVRMDIIAALSFNYPEETFLFDNAVHDESGYARVEHFCEEKWGVHWRTPRPPFLTLEGFPILGRS